jgi:hypothetical protein
MKMMTLNSKKEHEHNNPELEEAGSKKGDQDSNEDENVDGQEGKKHIRRNKSVGCDAMPYDMTGLDYLEGKSTKKGRYGVTVPKPFAFDIREKVRPKTIRQNKIDNMIEEKRWEDEQHLHYHFKPKPIPSIVLEPRFEKINTANEERREMVK